MGLKSRLKKAAKRVGKVVLKEGKDIAREELEDKPKK